MPFRLAFAAFCLLLSTPHVSIAANDFGHVPIGATIPYFGPLEKLPPSWSLCNGEVVRDQDSPLIGQRLPDLRDAFVRGASSKESIGKTGGSDEISTSPAGAHAHGGVTANTPDSEMRTSGVAGLHRHSGQTGSAGGGLSSNSGLPGGPGALSQRGSAHQHALNTDLTGNHSHNLPPTNAHQHEVSESGNHAHKGDNRPRHVEAYFICRIK
ncbi:MAG: hypothetical protein ACPGQV_00245 [Alphaproteobacteria bacterium]